jgi:flagellar hook capping protein FlgD
MSPFPFLAIAAALLSGQAGRSQDGYAALAAGDPSAPFLAITARGEVWSIEPVTRDTARCTQIAIAAPFASIMVTRTGGYYALTRSGAIVQGGRSASDCRTWRDCGLLVDPCEFVALGLAGSPERLVALSACGDLFLGSPGSCSWEFCGQVPDSSGRFTALGRTPVGGLYAVTTEGRVWHNPDMGLDRRRWVLDGQLPADRGPYVAIAGNGPTLILSAAGELAVRAPETGEWSLSGRIPASPGETFAGLRQDAIGTSFALTTGGTLWRASPAPPDCQLWHRYAEFPPPHGPESPREIQSVPRLTLMPNPVRGWTAVRLSLPASGFARLELHDAAGRLVRTLLAEERGSGTSTISWDGSLDSGHPAPPGIYFMRLRCGGLETVERVQIVR